MTEQTVSKSRKQMTLMFAIGLVPMFVAYIIYAFYPQLLPTTTTNVGTFISPPVQSSEVGIGKINEKWSLVIPVTGFCDDSCEERFYFARQVNVALGKESERVGRIFAVDHSLDDAFVQEIMTSYQGMELRQTDTGLLEKALKAALLDEHPEFETNQTILLMDPIGNIILYYSLDQAGKGMLKDIKHLLKISNIG